MSNFNMAYMDTCGPINMLLIHGFPLSNSIWAPQYDDLYDLARIIAPDLPGHGQSDPMPGTYTMEKLAYQCADLLDGLGIREPVVLGGLSMGGYVAFEFLRNFPRRVKGLILCATRPEPDSAEDYSARNRAVSLVKKKGVEALVDDMLPKLMAPATYAENGALVEAVREIMLGTTADGAVGALRGMQERPDSVPTLAKIDVPTLIIHGQEDQLIPFARAEAMHADIPGAELYVIPEAGHLPNLEQPILFNDIVADYLSRLM